MNKFIKKELKKCKVANIPDFDDSTTQIVIPCENLYNGISIEQDKYYIIDVDYKKLTSTVMINWNRGLTLKSTTLICRYKKALSNMRCFDACGYDLINRKALPDVYYGLWLPKDSFKVVREVER